MDAIGTSSGKKVKVPSMACSSVGKWRLREAVHNAMKTTPPKTNMSPKKGLFQ